MGNEKNLDVDRTYKAGRKNDVIGFKIARIKLNFKVSGNPFNKLIRLPQRQFF